jgi:hypothetical protein
MIGAVNPGHGRTSVTSAARVMIVADTVLG